MTTPASMSPAPAHERFAALFLLAVYVVFVVKTAWISDDAYITFRTIENAAAGLGLTWNPAERVQTYTHPLWMLLLLAARLLTGELYYTCILLSLLCGFATGLLIVLRLAATPLHAALALAVLASSKAFVDYSTSGLENPLLHLLLVLFVMACQPGRQGMFASTLLAALAATTRLDGVLVFAPLLLMRLWEQRTVRGFAAALAGAAPLLAWLAFAVIYYGSAVPNTAYAKLSTGLGWAELVQQGAFYLLHSAREDPLTLVVLLGGLLTPLATPGRQTMALSAGAGLYLIYVLRIGGDFMAGRMLTLPLLACVLTIARAERVGRVALLVALVSVLACAYATPRSPLHSFDGYDMWLGFYDAHGVCDERACYYQHTGLLKARFQRRFPDHPWLAEGAAAAAEPGVVVRENIGMFGYAAGPRVHIVDPWALADPLLARLPRRAGPWRIGHMQRDLPQGYLETLRTGDNCIADPQVAALYERVRLLTRGPLLDTRRLREIARAHLGF